MEETGQGPTGEGLDPRLQDQAERRPLPLQQGVEGAGLPAGGDPAIGDPAIDAAETRLRGIEDAIAKLASEGDALAASVSGLTSKVGELAGTRVADLESKMGNVLEAAHEHATLLSEIRQQLASAPEAEAPAPAPTDDLRQKALDVLEKIAIDGPQQSVEASRIRVDAARTILWETRAEPHGRSDD